MSTTRWARIGFSLVAWLFAAGAIIQVYLAGEAAFAANPTFELHRNFGFIVGLLTLVLVVLALAGRMPLRMIGATVLLAGLMVLQVVLVLMRTNSPNIAALHPVNAVLLIVLGLWLAWRSVGYIRAPLPPERPRPPAPVPAPTSPVPPEEQ